MRLLFAFFVLLLATACLPGCCGHPLWPLLEHIERRDEDQGSKRQENEIAMLNRLTKEDQLKPEQRELETREQELETRRQELEKRQRTEVRPRAFLERFGYLPPVPKNVSHEPTSMRRAIMRMQLMYHIKQTGELNEETIRMMKKPRCGFPDVTPKEPEGNSIAQNFHTPGYKWTKTHLKWKTRNYHNLLSTDVTRRAFSQAFKHWSDVSGLTFVETKGEADINMQFSSGDHGDGSYNAFDGSGGVLAHAFYPESGEVHFDEQEHWTDGKYEGTNLMIVASHELGHTFGLGHSEVEGALMAPVYQGYESNFKLRDDDIRAIQSLYGGPPGHPGGVPPDHGPTSDEPPVRPPLPDEPPNTCELIYKAMTQTYDTRIYVFNGRWMWRTSDYGLDQGFPLPISAYYENPPDDISATIFSWKSYYTYFFKNKRIWRYYGFQLVDEKEMESRGYPGNPSAAIASRDGYIYLIKDGYVWTFDESQMDIRPTGPIPFQVLFPGAPTEFDSVVRLIDDMRIIYFFKGLYYMKYNEVERRVLDGYPRPKAGPWMGPACGAEPYTPK